MDDEENSQERYAMMPPYSLPAADGETPEEGDTVRSGAVRDPAVPVSSEDEVVEALRTVFDPEIPVNIYDLGLIYDLKVAESGDVDIMMTLTAPACPVAGILPQEVADAAANLAGVGKVAVTITWDPPWTPENMSEVAKVALDMF
jgi:FeS assembly SUF system protein